MLSGKDVDYGITSHLFFSSALGMPRADIILGYMFEEVYVNFAKPMPILPLDSVPIFPQQLLPLQVREERYRDMIEKVLDSSGQFAIAMLTPRKSGSLVVQSNAPPPIRRAVCVAQIVGHESLPNGKYNLMVRGICRAHIRIELPSKETIPYREVMLTPGECGDEQSNEVIEAKSTVIKLIMSGELAKLRTCELMREWIEESELPNGLLFEYVSLAMIHDPAKRYTLLAEPDISRRAVYVRDELVHLERLIKQARSQRADLWPKGCSWN